MYLLNQLINIDEFELDVLNQDTIKGYLDLLMLVSVLETYPNTTVGEFSYMVYDNLCSEVGK